MLGAIIGDIAGSRFQRSSHKSKQFTLLSDECHPTDDSIMSLAIAKAVLGFNGDYKELSKKAVHYMQKLGLKYPRAGYGTSFYQWLYEYAPKPYNSWGNGSAMRVSPCGFAADSLENAKKLSEAVTVVTHNHPEGVKGAEAVAVAIYMARTGKSLDEIRSYINANYYKIDFTLDSIRPDYEFDVSCQGSVPQAFEAFFESTGFEDAIRNAVSIGGDSDTIAAMTGGIAEAYYGIPDDIRDLALSFLDRYQLKILHEFENKYVPKLEITADE